jgi:hypothetical protein
MSTQNTAEDFVGQRWTEVICALYEEEVVIEAEPRDVTLAPNSNVLDSTSLSEEEIIKELHYLKDQGLVEWTDVGPQEEHFVMYRLTGDGFKIAHERVKAVREDQQESAHIAINKSLTFATILLAVTAIIQALANVYALKPSVRGPLLLLYQLLLVFLAVLMVGTLNPWRDYLSSISRYFRQ